ncbi:unnamed protein product [Notodromas monacha]|uniref:Anion exchange protein n=1 Tax=Notodromas monacha TaxID=399045 RepID=A0A7R9BMT1_9CRUS|nr:unnamed protein product [Notodromas monacha]CAG0916883.1 unnamed protein product [Notodromas monacha]
MASKSEDHSSLIRTSSEEPAPPVASDGLKSRKKSKSKTVKPPTISVEETGSEGGDDKRRYSSADVPQKHKEKAGAARPSLQVESLQRDGGYVNVSAEPGLRKEAAADSAKAEYEAKGAGPKRPSLLDPAGYHFGPRHSLVDANLVENYFESRRKSDDLRWRRLSNPTSIATGSSSDNSDNEEADDKSVHKDDRSQSVPSHGIMDKMKAAAAADDDRRSSDAMPSPLYRPVDDDAPQVSQRAALAARADRGESLRQGQVQFEVGSLTDVRDENGKIKGKHRKDKSRREEDPTWRIRSGSEIEPSFQQARLNPTEADEASTLGHADLDDMASHRYDHVKHSRRHRNSHNLVHISRKDGADVLPQLMKKTIDHAPHDIFVQLDELYVTLSGQEWEWKQTARWIKYEENVEEGGKWGKAHVASLSFHSLLNLRVVLLDLEADDMTGVVNRVVEQLVISDQIHPEDRGAVLRTLLLRHKAVDDNEAFFKNLNDKGAWPKLVPSLTNLAGQDGLSCSVSNMNPNLLSPNEATGYVRSGSIRFGSISSYRDVESAADALGSQGLRHVPSNSILRKIPAGSEATMVLVGAVDFLELPAVAFIRLAKGTTFPGVTEVPIPTRFLFFLLGPLNTDLDYHEIGRSIGTLMSNPGFNEVAYKTETRRDLLCAINEFLDDSIVLPPGEWESKTLLHIEDLQMKSREIRERKKQRLEMEKQLERQSLTVQDEKALAVVAADGMRLSLGGDGGPPDDPLERTGHLFGGMFRDIKRRYPKYLSDLRDALNPVCLATAVFIYFAALSGAITFGGLYGEKSNFPLINAPYQCFAGAKTDNLIGVSETLIATAFTGVMFALFAGQPLIIVGATGPVLLFDQSLFSFCASQGIDFLPLRVWVGMWLGVIGLIFTAFEGACFVRFFTRFTEEIFASLVSLLFIFESFFKLYTVYRDHPLLADYCFVTESTIATLIANETVNGTLPMTTTMSPMTTFASSNITLFGLDRVRREIADQGVTVEEDALPMNEPNTALMSTVLMLGTFFIAYFLRHFRNSKFLGRSVSSFIDMFLVCMFHVDMFLVDFFLYARRALGDFGVPIAIVTMVVVDYLVEDTYTEKLSVPEGLSPSNSKVRGWLISPFAENLPTWMIFAAALPAVLVFILIFMETQICQLIINKKCTKGSGHHLDIALLCLLNMLCALFGAPWQPAATVRAVSHVSALTVWSTNQAPGEKPKILEVKGERKF